MATRDDILGVFQFLGVDEPPEERLDRIVEEVESGERNIADVRNDLIDFQAEQQGVDAGTIVGRLVQREFSRLGLEPAAEERVDRIVQEIYGGSQEGDIDEGRRFTDVRENLEQFAEESGTEEVGDTTIPAGMRLVRVRNPEGSDQTELFFLVGEWRGVEFAYEVGDDDRVEELFGGPGAFDNVSTVSQTQFDRAGFVESGSADQLYGTDESLASQFEREVRALGMEDLPAWLGQDEDALALVAQATAQGWSSGRLWQELSDTGGFRDRFGDILGDYTEGGTPIGTAVEQIIQDEQSLRSTIRRFRPEGFQVTNEYLHQVMQQGWTSQQAASVLDVAEDIRRNPDGLRLANEILTSSGLGTLDEVEFLNVLAGGGDEAVQEALNTAQAARALTAAGLEDVDTELLMDVVDTSDRLLTMESYQELAQQLSFNVMRNTRELDMTKLGLTEDDLVASAFGRESPTGKSAGEVLNLLARFERDRRAASQFSEGSQAFINRRGRLQVQGFGGL